MRLFILVLSFLFTITIFGQSSAKIYPSLKKGDSLHSIQEYSSAFDFYQNKLKSNKALSDTNYQAEIFHRLSLISEELKHFPEAISNHMNWRKLQPFPTQQENQRYFDKVVQLLPKATDSLGLTRLYYRYALLLIRENERNLAFAYFKRALEFANNIKSYAAMATIANEMAGEYYDAGLRDLSNEMYKESIIAAKALYDTNRIAGAYLNLAGNYIEEGDFALGIQMHLDALKLKESIEDNTNLIYYYLQTAIVYSQAHNFPKWEEYVWKAYRIKDCEPCTPPREKAMLYAELGGIAKYKNQIQAALGYYDTLLVLSKEIAYFNGQKTAYDNQALIYKDLGEYEKALELANLSEAFLNDNPFNYISNNNTKVELLLETGKPQEALVLLDENATNKVLSNYSSERLRTFRLLYQTNVQLKNYHDAYRWNDSLRVLETLLRNADVGKEMAALETRYQTEKKEHQISLLTAENKIINQRIRLGWLLIGFLFVLIILALALLFFRRKQAYFRQSELQQKLLRSQMNPHFIFNVMGSIQSYLYKNEAAKAADYLSCFARLSRSVLDYSSQENISLKDEIEMLQNYIELEKARMTFPFEVEYIFDEEMEIDFIEIPPMLIQPFVENAIKHGFWDLDYPGKLSLCFREKKDHISVEILDNGKGLNTNKNGNHNSKALEIFMQRKKGIERRCKKELTFEFQNLNTLDKTKHGVRVYLQLPILNND